MKTETKFDWLIFGILVIALMGLVWWTTHRAIEPPPPPPPNVCEFEILIVDSSGVQISGTLTVESDDVMPLITGDRWIFQPVTADRRLNDE